MENDKNDFGFWGIAQFMGFKKCAGYITEEQRFGSVIGRIDIPLDEERFLTHYFNSSSIYMITPCSEEIARAFARKNQERPVSIYELELPSEIEERSS